MKKVIIGINLIAIATPAIALTKNEVQHVQVVDKEVSAPQATRININFASKQQISDKAKVSITIATSIVEYRTSNGFFKSIDDLIKVKGIGPATLEKIKPYVYI